MWPHGNYWLQEKNVCCKWFQQSKRCTYGGLQQFASNLSNHYWVLAATPFFCEQIHQEMAVSNTHLQQEKPMGNLLPTSL